MSFMICAAPGWSPATTTVGPHRRKTGINSATFAASPETMMASVPSRAPDGPPLMGASMMVTPAAAHAWPISARNGLPTVQVLTRVLSAEPESSPFRSCHGLHGKP